MDNLKSCLVSDQLYILKDFYQKILNCDTSGDADCIEVKFNNFKLFIISRKIFEQKTQEWTTDMNSEYFEIQEEVEDIDNEYNHLVKEGVEIVQMPTTLPFGTRIISFKDPDGNIIKFWQNKDKCASQEF